jgi:CRP/FNR family transcriptional regulator
VDVLKRAASQDVESVAALLADHSVFSCFSEEFMAPPFIDRHLKWIPRNDVLYEVGGAAEECYLICSGRVGLLSEGPWGRPCLLTVKSRGAVVGDLSLFDHAPRTSTARALEPSLILVIPYQVMHKNLLDHPEATWRVLGAYAARIRAYDDRLAEALNLDLMNRLARRLLEISHGQAEFALDITQEEIASHVGASRERTNKALAALQRCGILTIDNHHLYRICDPDKLARLALQRSDDRSNTERLSNDPSPVRSDLIKRS